MSDIYRDFLQKLGESINKNKKINLKGFVDRELCELYQRILMENESPLPKIDLVFQQFGNKHLDKVITLNYYFNHTYVLNLDRRPDRINTMKKELKKIGIFNWSRFPAVDGKQSPHYEEWQTYRRQRMTQKEKIKYQRKAIGSAGSWAILKSMYLMIKDAIKKNYQTILVMQDDLLFHRNYVAEMLKMPMNIPKNWKLLYLGATQHNWNHVEMRSHYYFPMGTADGAFSVGIHCSVFKELLYEIAKFQMPFDSGPLKVIQRHYGRQCIVLYPNLIIADIRDSDLRGSRNLEVFSSKFRWNLKLFQIPNI